MREITTQISKDQVAAFRLSKHHLRKRAPTASVGSILADMAGAQAQVLQAAQMSIWTRVRAARIQDLNDAIWKDRKLVRAWCMRRTMFLLPSDELAVFVRGSSRRAGYGLQWALSGISSRQALDKLMDDVLEILDQPRTRSELAQTLSKSFGYKLKFKAGGGWGDRRSVPYVEAGGVSLSVGFLLHLMGARDVLCSGPSMGAEATFVRADKWLRGWKDIPTEKAEDELLERYLGAFGPATLSDFALWAGLYARDAKEIWSRGKIAQVEVDGVKNAGVLESDLPELEKAKIDQEPIVRLLPYFDSFLLGHRSHSNIVDALNQRKIYRAQGWVSPVVLVNGVAQGVWSQVQRKNDLEILVTPFSKKKLSSAVSSQVREEASDLGRFLGFTSVKSVIA